MPAFRGNFWQVGLGHQTAEGSLTAPTQMYRWIEGSEVMPDIKTTEYFEGDGSIDPTFLNKDSSMWKGKIKFYPRSTDIGQVLAMVAGTGSETIRNAPTGLTATAASGGSLPTGTIHYAVAFKYGQIVGPLSADLSVTTTSTNATATISGISADAAATGMRIYKGPVGGAAGTYTQYADVAIATSVSDTGTTPTFSPVPTNLLAPSTTGVVHTYVPQTVSDFWTCEFGQIITGANAPTNQIRLWVGDCVPMALTLTLEPNRPVTAELDFLGKFAQVVSSLTAPVFDPGSRPLIMSNAIFYVDGQPVTTVGKTTIKIDFTVSQDIFTASQIWPYAFIEERRKVSVDYELIFQDASKFWNFVTGGLSTNPTAGTVVDSPAIATGMLDFALYQGGVDVNNALGLTINNINYQVKPVTWNLQGKAIRQPVSGFAMRSSLPLYTAQLRNARATTY